MKRNGMKRLFSLLAITLLVMAGASLVWAQDYTVTNGSTIQTVFPLEKAGSAADYYSYDSPFTDSGDPGFGTRSDVGFLWLYRDTLTGKLSLGMIFDKPNDGSAGSVQMAFSGMPATAAVVVADDPDTTDTLTTLGGKWSWAACCTDGGVIGGLNGTWVISLGLVAATGIDEWYFLSGPVADSPTRIRLDMTHEVVIAASLPGSVVKWLQPPDMNFGVNLVSVDGRILTADDWRCESPKAVTDVHFWGSYLGWEAQNPEPDPFPPQYMPLAFVIRIYEDVPAGIDPQVPYSHPGPLMYEATVDKYRQIPFGHIIREQDIEHKFYYSLDLPEPFEQEEGSVYWISIAAVMPEQAPYPWGWETSPVHWNDHPVQGDDGQWTEVIHRIPLDMGFEDLVVGTTYPVGAVFSSSGVNLAVKPFTASGGIVTMGHVLVDDQGKAGGSGKDLNLNNVNLEFGIHGSWEGLSLRYGHYGGDLNLEVNGDRKIFDNFSAVHGTDIGGVHVTVQGTGQTGILSFVGAVTQFAVGGQELWIDEVKAELGRAVDMAFALTVPPEPPPSPPEPIKWQQRPDRMRGVNIESLAFGSEMGSVADDWLCLGGSPVSDLHFWGSYLYWKEDIPALGPGTLTPGVEAFRIRIYSDGPASPGEEYSRPARLLYETWVSDFRETYVGSILHDLDEWFFFEHKFRYDLDLPRMFHQRRDRIYWLNIAAVPQEGQEEEWYSWGWESSMDHWNDAAVWGDYFSVEDWYWEPIMGGAFDMSFELTTCGGPIKWLQFPDMAHGKNILSPAVGEVQGVPQPPRFVADDWVCTNGKHITEVRLWGSYLNRDGTIHWQQENENLSGVTPPSGPAGFILRFYEDVPAGADPNMPWSHPGALLQEVMVGGENLVRRYWDSVRHQGEGPEDPPWWEHKFYYVLTLPLMEVFKQEEGKVYWLSPEAVYEQEPDWFWGWETSKDHWNDSAVQGDGLRWNALGGVDFSGFEDLVSGTTYTVGHTFTTSGMDVRVGPFQWSDGTWTNTGGAMVVALGQAGGSGNEMAVDNVNLEFTLPGPARGFSLLFGEYGGNVNLRVNGDFRNVEDFSKLNGLTVGGALVTVVNGLGNDKGSLHLKGIIREVAVGGQELWIDDVSADRPVDMAFLLITEDDTEFCYGDFDRDGDVDLEDLEVFAGDYGRNNCYDTGDCEADFRYDGDVDGLDLALFMAEYGRSDCPCALLRLE